MGAGAGALVGLLADDGHCEWPCFYDPGPELPAALGAVMGGALGALVSLSPREEWDVARGYGVTRRSAVRLRTLRGGAALSVAFAF